MSEKDFDKACDDFDAAWGKYFGDAWASSERSTDKVGKPKP